ncbi:MAG: S8 family serine peptidase [Bacteroidetes bacterium]|nr:S8 family serine peptidase [Fibrella sp.]
MLRNPLLLLFFLIATGLRAQPTATSKYWIVFRDKATSPGESTPSPALSPNALASRRSRGLAVDETDRPLSSAYLTRLRRLGIVPECPSRWLNAVSAQLSPAQQAAVSQLPFVREIIPLDPHIIITSVATPAKRASNAVNQSTTSNLAQPQLAPVLSQIQADAFARAGLTGRFVSVGVIDAGFFAADSASALRHIFVREGIRAVRDYVNPQKTQNNLFRTLETMSDTHGTEVLAAIAGLDPTNNVQYGLATDATFYLARTDQGNREFRGEEDNWVAAMEWMDSLGVRLINTSLGCTKGMTNPADNYQPSQMDGHTSLISRAAQMAVEKKGILLIVSAGNEGDDRNWRIISTPADASGVLAIGATNSRLWNRIGYSSIGPEELPYLKPNVSCYSLYGTSLSAPVITGFAACLMQANPKLTNRELMSVIEQSSHLYPYGNNFVGYGVPQASRALALLRKQTPPPTSRTIQAVGKTITLPVASTEPQVSVFRKKDATHVMHQEALKATGNKLVIRRLAGEKQTTVDLKKEVIEVVWE